MFCLCVYSGSVPLSHLLQVVAFVSYIDSSLLYFSRHRSHIILKGLGRVGTGNQRDLEIVKTRVTAVLTEIGAGREFSVISVIVYGAGSPVYNAELNSEESVQSILSAFSRFTRRHQPVSRPQSLEGISLHRAVTVGTRVRISLLRVSVFSPATQYYKVFQFIMFPGFVFLVFFFFFRVYK